VPTQRNVPYGAAVAAFPVVEDGAFVWVWMGEAKLAGLRPAPRTPWLHDPQWVTFGESWTTRASIRLLWDNFADITHVAHLHPEIAPPALSAGETPPLEVTVSETGMSFARSYPPSAVSDWHAQVMEVEPAGPFGQVEEGELVSPGLWVDRWHVDVDGQQRSFVFTHALTPVDETTTRHVWQVSRNFGSSAAATGTLRPLFETYYRKVQQVLQTMQQVVSEDGPRQEVLVAADAGAVQVRRIMDRLVADETGVR
jgi:vanillate O-demethylase monooxygenase subunit